MVCGVAGRLEVDHILRVQSGGEPWDMGNLQSLCRPDHFAKTRLENKPDPFPGRQAWADKIKELTK